MARITVLRLMTAAILVAAEAAAVTALVATGPAPAQAQFFDDRFPFQNRRLQRGPFDWFGTQPQYDERSTAPPPDFSKAPAAKRSEPKGDNGITPIMVLGDAMADWLAYGLELAYGDSPEIGILRRHRTNSGLIRSEGRNDPRGEYPDWPQAARDLIAAQRPKFVVMMVGINDRRQIRETAQVLRPNRPVPVPQPDDPAALDSINRRRRSLLKRRLPRIPRPPCPEAGPSSSAPIPGATLMSGASTTRSQR